MENVTLVMIETANSYKDVMDMPLGALLLTVKHIRITHLMQNPEWRDAYAKWQLAQSYKNGTIKKETEIDIEGLMNLQKTI